MYSVEKNHSQCVETFSEANRGCEHIWSDDMVRKNGVEFALKLVLHFYM